MQEKVKGIRRQTEKRRGRAGEFIRGSQRNPGLWNCFRREKSISYIVVGGAGDYSAFCFWRIQQQGNWKCAESESKYCAFKEKPCAGKDGIYIGVGKGYLLWKEESRIFWIK